jgi:GTP-binding protein
MFVDRAIVTFKAGNGGNGCLSFRREKFVPKGGPDGGDGGNGGDIVLVCKSGNESLVDFKFRNLIKAENGVPGKGGNKTGKNGKDEILYVPTGTVVKTFPDERIMADLTEEGQRFVIAEGGKGGRGNARFKSSVNQAPRITESGQTGETIKVVLELKLIAFAGLVGLPNAGKSTLISRVSGAKPKIADYPFTTLSPNLGVVYWDYESLVLADIPGIIEGAHRGEGMGLDFLRHIERNRVLVFLLDISGFTEQPPLTTLKTLMAELRSYDRHLLKKDFMVVGNKVDLLEGRERDSADELASFCRQNDYSYLEISAVKGIRLEEFKSKLFEFYRNQTDGT